MYGNSYHIEHPPLRTERIRCTTKLTQNPFYMYIVCLYCSVKGRWYTCRKEWNNTLLLFVETTTCCTLKSVCVLALTDDERRCSNEPWDRLTTLPNDIRMLRREDLLQAKLDGTIRRRQVVITGPDYVMCLLYQKQTYIWHQWGMWRCVRWRGWRSSGPWWWCQHIKTWCGSILEKR